MAAQKPQRSGAAVLAALRRELCLLGLRPEEISGQKPFPATPNDGDSSFPSDLLLICLCFKSKPKGLTAFPARPWAF
ncbi:rCG34622 [Rattus norvegicus]|uniref:RCG34622 n=1 Tax=Rattus norvegicus TaxID=10116 RepID=A6HIH8_RAT|nr:rCG34622 [Rattus norvegicus]